MSKSKPSDRHKLPRPLGNRNESIFNHSPIPMLLLSHDEQFAGAVNQAFCKWTGYPQDNPISARLFLETFLGDPSTLEMAYAGWLHGVEQLHKQGGTVKLPDLRLKLADNSEAIAFGEITLIDNSIQVTMVDQTDVVESEGRFRGMIEDVSLPITVCREGEILYSNPYINSLLDLSADEVKQKHLKEIYRYTPDHVDVTPWGTNNQT